MSMTIKERLKDGLLFFDGAMGTMLQARGLPAGGLPEILNITEPETITDIHRQYVRAGSNIITANTFGANALKLKDAGYTPEKVIAAGVKNALASGAEYVALDIGPLGQLLKPAGGVDFEDAVGLFARQVRAGAAAGADLILIETMSDLYETKAAVIAAKENCALPVFVCMTFGENGRTFMGCDALTAATALGSLGADALGVNCSCDPFKIAPVMDTMLRYSRVSVIAMPNAGLPSGGGSEALYGVTPEQFAAALKTYYKAGASVFGGCCGTTPAHIARLTAALTGKKPVLRRPERITAVTSGVQTAVIGGGTLIGERLNPAGKPKLKEALKNGDTAYIVGEAVRQQGAGAAILDVNCGLPGIDEPAAAENVIKELQSVINIPLQIDSADPRAIERAARIYNGKPLINSVSGTKESMERVFPAVKKYGAAVIGLTLDEDGIPADAGKRLAIAEKIVRTAASCGIPKEDILIDCLVLTASAQQEQVFETLEAVRLVKKRLGVKTILGVSNVSFGLPDRALLNGVFLAAALYAGLDAAIADPLSEEINGALKAFGVLSGADKGAKGYIAAFGASARGGAAAGGVKEKETAPFDAPPDLAGLIVSGRKEAASAAVKSLLDGGEEPLNIVDGSLIPALDLAGAQYEKGVIFLPQLIQAAEAAKVCFDAVKAAIPQSGGLSKGKVLLATVRGDIHDIGKNIVKVLLQSYRYEVIDLGRDADCDFVAREAARHKARLAGLSALMTTTLPAMKETIEKIRRTAPGCKIMVGGAVLNEEYARSIGADYYAKDARAGIRIADEVLRF